MRISDWSSDVCSSDLINRGLINCKLGKHVTMLGGVIDQEHDVLHYSIGGHLPMPVLYTGEGAHYLEGRGLPVGLFVEATYQNFELKLPETFSLDRKSTRLNSGH